ncbi:MAG: metallophosphoesterase [Candidatus Moranbacteria bacterium]|nr:metallophosphoesterase [Candidatus Moranbacteria bacterium]
MKFAIITDIHLGPEEYHKGILRKVNKNVKTFLGDFIKEMNKNVKPELVIALGDLIQDENPVSDKDNLNYIIESLKGLNCPVYYVAGNHDLKNISEDDLAKLFKQKSLYYSFDSGHFHFIVLFSKRFDDKIRFYISDKQKKWLQKDLDGTEKQCLVFVHYGLADQDLTENPFFEGKPEKCLVMNRKEIRSILSKSKKVIAAFDSHLHWNRMYKHNSIPYFTIQSLVENEDDKGLPSQAYAVVDIEDKKISVEIKGNYPKKFIRLK